jgi:hypothetical protein
MYPSILVTLTSRVYAFPIRRRIRRRASLFLFVSDFSSQNPSVSGDVRVFLPYGVLCRSLRASILIESLQHPANYVPFTATSQSTVDPHVRNQASHAFPFMSIMRL